MDLDIRTKRAAYIGQSLEVRESFKFASPVEILTALEMYCSSYYGSLAGWELGGEAAKSFYNCWSTNVKLTWAVPRATRTYLVQQVLSLGFLARFGRFFR